MPCTRAMTVTKNVSQRHQCDGAWSYWSFDEQRLQPRPLIVLGLNVWMGTGADELVEIELERVY